MTGACVFSRAQRLTLISKAPSQCRVKGLVVDDILPFSATPLQNARSPAGGVPVHVVVVLHPVALVPRPALINALEDGDYVTDSHQHIVAFEVALPDARRAVDRVEGRAWGGDGARAVLFQGAPVW